VPDDAGPLLADLVARLARLASTEGVSPTPIPRVSVIRFDRPGEPMPAVYTPSVCVVAQGTKAVRLGSERFVYDGSRFIVASVDLPVLSHVLEASPAAPYLCLALELDLRTVAGVMLDTDPDAHRGAGRGPARGMFVGAATPTFLDAVVRLVRLADTPQDIALLAPLVEREIVYRLLRDAQGWRLAQMARQGQARRIAGAVAWIKAHFAEPLRVEHLAREANMSVSSFHAYFKRVTAMSPLQYQKQMRLQEARRLLLDDAVDAATAGHQVGYESPSQFSREYRRAFGAPPATDARLALRSAI
jgi:AraC-like DNA-binding protein